MVVVLENVAPGARLRYAEPVLVRGSVGEGAHVESDAWIDVRGDVCDAELYSRTADVIVGGMVSGSSEQSCGLGAVGDVRIGCARLARICSGLDVVASGTLWQSIIYAGRYLRLNGQMDDTLHDVQLRAGSGVLVGSATRPRSRPGMERLDARVGCQLQARCAREADWLCFLQGTVTDLSASGLRVVTDFSDLGVAWGSRVQVHVCLDDGDDPVVVIGRVVRRLGSTVSAVHVEDIGDRDRRRLYAYVRSVGGRSGRYGGSVGDRRMAQAARSAYGPGSGLPGGL